MSSRTHRQVSQNGQLALRAGFVFVGILFSASGETASRNLYQAAVHEREAGNCAAAFGHLTTLLDRGPASDLAGVASHLRAVCLAESGSYDEALAAFRAFLAIHPRGELSNKARVYIDLLTKHRAPDDQPLLLFMKHLRLHEAGRYRESVTAGRTLLARFPTASLAAKTRNAIAYVYLVDLQDYEGAIGEFNAVLRHHPGSPLADNALFGIATAEERRRRFDAALKVYELLRKKHQGWFGPKANYWSRLWYERTKGRIEAIDALVCQNDYLGVLTDWTPYDMKYRRIERFFEAQPYAGHRAGELSDHDAYYRVRSLIRQARRLPYLRETATQDFWQIPPETQARPGGDCEDQAVWLFDQMQGLGIRNCRVFLGKRNARGNQPHAWVILYTKSNGYILDPTEFAQPYQSRAFSKSDYVPHYSFLITRRWHHGRSLR